MRKLLLTPLLALVFVSQALAAEAKLTVTTPAESRSFTLRELKARIKPVAFTVFDIVYNKEKTYDGFPLDAVLKLVGGAGTASAGIDELLFHCADGYSPGIPIKKTEGHPAFVAFGEHGNAKGWTKVQTGKKWITPAPFYLLWAEGKGVGEEYPRPYQLVGIELVSFAGKFPKLYPRGVEADSGVMKGFYVFKAMCLRCHSINLEGGTLAPELNVPQNITEYWSRDTLRKFITNVAAFRAKSSMPVFEKVLSQDEVDEVLQYLERMKEQKISLSEGAAPAAKE